jgi:hypothetical protein
VQPAKPGVGKVKPANASAGASAVPSGTPEDASAEHEREMDERRATESKQKMKKRPGYKEEVPLPRV